MTDKPKQPVKQDIFTILGTVLGMGFMPIMPGTFSTLAAALLYLGMPQNWFIQFPAVLYTIGSIIVLYFAGVFITGKIENKLGHDASSIVLDEFAAYFICVLFLPKSILMAVYTFVVFRVFDNAKPQPIKLLQKMKGGWGVMTDDVVAAVLTNLFMQIMIRIYPRFFML